MFSGPREMFLQQRGGATNYGRKLDISITLVLIYSGVISAIHHTQQFNVNTRMTRQTVISNAEIFQDESPQVSNSNEQHVNLSKNTEKSRKLPKDSSEEPESDSTEESTDEPATTLAITPKNQTTGYLEPAEPQALSTGAVIGIAVGTSMVAVSTVGAAVAYCTFCTNVKVTPLQNREHAVIDHIEYGDGIGQEEKEKKNEKQKEKRQYKTDDFTDLVSETNFAELSNKDDDQTVVGGFDHQFSQC